MTPQGESNSGALDSEGGKRPFLPAQSGWDGCALKLRQQGVRRLHE